MSILALTSNTLVTAASGQIEYNGQFFGTDSNASRAQMQRITQGTAVASTSGTSIDFTGLPAWVKRITVMFQGVSTNGTDAIVTLLGTGATPTYATTGYNSAASYLVASSLGTNGLTTGFLTAFPTNVSSTIGGHLTLTNLSGNIWAFSCAMGDSVGVRVVVGGGNITLGAALTAVRIGFTGANNFDAGSMNIMYEG
jgi:hypothetical protein